MIAEHVAEDGGDCRQAITYLLRVGRVAGKKGLKTVTEGEVVAVLES